MMPNMSRGFCGVEMAQGLSSTFGTVGTGVGAITGTLSSLATAIRAAVAGAPAVPMTTSTLSSSINLRVFLAAVEGSDASSSTMMRNFSPAASPT